MNARKAADITAREMRKGLRRAQVAALMPDKLRALMIATIIEAVRDRGAVTADDLARANIPKDFIDTNFKPCLALAKDQEPQLFRD